MSYFKRLYDSPTFMTWFSFSAKSLSILVVLPLILSSFSKSEISLWYLFNILFGFQILADLGFGNTFSRIISYSMVGLDNIDSIGLNKLEQNNLKKPNWDLIVTLKKEMGKIFFIIAIVFISIITLISILFLDEPIERLDNSESGYILLSLILFVLFIKVYSRRYISFITGVNKVALLRRWEGFIIYLQIISSILILITTSNFYYLVINNQVWVLVGVANTYFLQKRILKSHNIYSYNENINLIKIPKKSFINHVFMPAIKSGIGTLSSYGLNQFSSFLLIDFLVEDDLVIYLICFRFISIISEFSRAPFYAKIPYFNQQYHSNTNENLLKIVKVNINTSILLAVICCLLILLFGDFSLELIRSKVKHLDYLLWFLLSLNLIFERLGAMHFQLHSLSNKVVWHKANLIYGVIFITVILLSIKEYGMYSIPIAMLTGNVCYYTFTAIKTTFKEFSYNILRFHYKIILYIIILASINLIFLLK
ncbi:polysaccharide biosynthesis protein [Polaribacter septentrionalilitoris]|uniref:hypothetical protein n=1 Tax=Polaribacter septentrionalilitoris TaxID=2494657 RepID=UPI00135AD5D3|nr:hypothetical protein [Polaribacter septentrionalilitoris]